MRRHAKKAAVLATLIAAATAAEKHRGWKEFHRAAAVIGIGAAVMGFFR